MLIVIFFSSSQEENMEARYPQWNKNVFKNCDILSHLLAFLSKSNNILSTISISSSKHTIHITSMRSIPLPQSHKQYLHNFYVIQLITVCLFVPNPFTIHKPNAWNCHRVPHLSDNETPDKTEQLMKRETRFQRIFKTVYVWMHCVYKNNS